MTSTQWRTVHVVSPASPSIPEIEAVRILRSRLAAGGVEVTESAVDAALRVVLGTPDSSSDVRTALESSGIAVQDLGAEGFVILPGDDEVTVAANTGPAVVFGVGRLLRECLVAGQGLSPLPEAIRSSPVLPLRNIYLADHMGNWYSHAPEEEVFEYLDEMALWGYNELMTCLAVKAGETFHDSVARVRRLEEAARRLGMRAGPVVQSNTSYVGPAPEHRADPVPIAGPYDVCPSKPGATEFLIDDKRQYLALMAPFDYICLWPYDGGGCASEDCKPWGRTYLELSRRLAAEAVPGDAEVWVSAWFFEKYVAGEDDALFGLLEERPDWFGRVVTGSEEARRWVDDGRKVPAGYDVTLFPDIAMFDGIPWGRGANPAARRFTAELSDTRSLVHGAVVYSEGRYDDFNKVLWALLLWNPELAPSETAREYCRVYFGPAAADEGAELLLMIEAGMEALPDPERWRRGSFHPEWDAAACRVEALMTEEAKASWRWELVRAKTKMELLTAELHDPGADREDLVRQLRTVYERVRDVINLHDPERSLATWFWAPLEEAFPFLAGIPTGAEG